MKKHQKIKSLSRVYPRSPTKNFEIFELKLSTELKKNNIERKKMFSFSRRDINFDLKIFPIKTKIIEVKLHKTGKFTLPESNQMLITKIHAQFHYKLAIEKNSEKIFFKDSLSFRIAQFSGNLQKVYFMKKHAETQFVSLFW